MVVDSCCSPVENETITPSEPCDDDNKSLSLSDKDKDNDDDDGRCDDDGGSDSDGPVSESAIDGDPEFSSPPDDDDDDDDDGSTIPSSICMNMSYAERDICSCRYYNGVKRLDNGEVDGMAPLKEVGISGPACCWRYPA